MSIKIPAIRLYFQEEELILEAPYHEGLVVKLKQLPQNDRRFDGRTWRIAKDCKDIIRPWCEEAAAELDAVFLDFTTLSEEEIGDHQRLFKAKLLAQKESAFLDLMPKLPRACFALISWSEVTVSLNLQLYLDDSELFSSMINASVAHKNDRSLIGYNFRQQPGWVFEIPRTNKVIKALIENQTRFLKYQELFFNCTSRSAVQFVDATGKLWFGLPLAKIPETLINVLETAAPWSLTFYQDQWFLVSPFHQFLEIWIKRKLGHFVSSFDEPILVPVLDHLPFSKVLEQCGLEVLYRDWFNELNSSLDSVSAQNTMSMFWEFWDRTDEEEKQRLQKFGCPNFAEIEASKKAIVEQKIKVERLQREQQIKAAPQKAEQLLKNSYTKDQLLHLSGIHGLEIKKSWKKGKMIEAILNSSNYQQIALAVCGVDA